MKKLLGLLFILLSIHSFSQNLDSLEKVVVKLKGKEKVKTLSDLCYYLSFSDVDKSEKYGQECLKLATELNDSILIANAHNDLSILYTKQSKYDKALEHNFVALKIREKLNEPEMMISSLSKIGVCYSEKAEFKTASKYILNAIKIVEDNKLEQKYYLVYDNLGGLYKEMEELNNADLYYKKAYNFALKANNRRDILLTLVNVANISHKKGNYQESLKLHLNAEKLIDENSDLRTTGLIYSNLSSIYGRLQQPKKALEYGKKSVPYYEKLSNFDGLSLIHNNIAGIYLENYSVKENQKKTLDHLKLAEKYADSSNSEIRKFQNSNSFGDYYIFIGDYESAKKYREKSEIIQLAIYNEEHSKTVQDLNAKYETEKKEKQIALQAIESQEKEAEINQRNRWIVGLIIGLFTIGFIGFLVYRQQKTKRKGLEVASQLKDVIHQQKLQNELYEERLRISRDLHDNIGSQLTFISSSIDNIQYGNKDEQLNDKLSNIVDFTKSTTSQLRDTIWAMNKSGVTAKELEARIFNYVKQSDKIQNRTEISFQNKLENKDFTLNALQGMNCYRIIQEAINNAIKYAMAKSVFVLFEENQNNLFISIQDDGIGFKMTEIELGNGLKNMQYRAKEIGGKMEINSSKENGTKIELTIPKNTLKNV